MLCGDDLVTYISMVLTQYVMYGVNARKTHGTYGILDGYSEHTAHA